MLLSSAAGAQESRVYTRPAPLSREALDRLHLKQAWRALIPVTERRDGIFSVQFLGDQIIVQTRAGVLVAINAADGSTQWRKSVGVAYRVNHGIGYNSENIFRDARHLPLCASVARAARKCGSSTCPARRRRQPTADDEAVYVATGIGRLHVFELPRKQGDKPLEKPEEWRSKRILASRSKPSRPSPYGVRGSRQTAVGPLSSARTSGSGRIEGPQPELLWDFKADCDHRAGADRQR